MANDDVRQLLIFTFEKPASSAGFRSALRAGVGAVMSPLYPASFSTPCVTPFSPRIPLLHTPRKNAPQPRRAAGPGCLSACRPVRPHRANQGFSRRNSGISVRSYRKRCIPFFFTIPCRGVHIIGFISSAYQQKNQRRSNFISRGCFFIVFPSRQGKQHSV